MHLVCTLLSFGSFEHYFGSFWASLWLIWVRELPRFLVSFGGMLDGHCLASGDPVVRRTRTHTHAHTHRHVSTEILIQGALNSVLGKWGRRTQMGSDLTGF